MNGQEMRYEITTISGEFIGATNDDLPRVHQWAHQLADEWGVTVVITNIDGDSAEIKPRRP